MKKLIAPLLISTLIYSCSTREKADLLIFNATIYTVDSSFSIAEAMAIKDGKIVATGKTIDLEKKFDAKEKTDARGKFIYPGLMDAHSHFTSYGFSLNRVNLTGTKSWEEILEKVKSFATENPNGWLLGQGWDQNDWNVKTFPDNQKLNELFPDRPVFLTRVDGHAAIANKKALELSEVKAGDKLTGGEVEVKNGKLSGILVDNAVDLVSIKIPASSVAELKEALLDAQQNCFAAGLTSVSECGLGYKTALFMDSLQKAGDLKMRIYVLLSDNKENMDFAFQNARLNDSVGQGKIKTDRLSVCGFKFLADGALGSRGACLLQPYSDRQGWYGFLLSSQQHFDSAAKIISEKGWQMCTHAIGDSGNRMILNVYAKYLKGKNDLRWRVEHAQIINENDFKLFGEFSIIPSVQPTHATSDMYWAGDRLGKERLKGAYAFKQLLQQNGWEPLGTDFPVEDISPIKTFYAAVVRKDAKGWPEGGFQMENALTREEALKGMTIWAAKAQFEEKEKGSLEKGKFADFIVLDNDLMTTAPEKLLEVNILKTFVGGEKVFEKK
ncbi:MAG: amidohydrolase [Bacteroidetes bacterium]|nr:amidohydrolase [Bacteroidota bacterium]MBS1633157.1 amidohydrolase [Bacteroidota bacterium]